MARQKGLHERVSDFFFFGRIRAGGTARDMRNTKINCQLEVTGHVFHPGYRRQSSLADGIIARHVRIALASSIELNDCCLFWQASIPPPHIDLASRRRFLQFLAAQVLTAAMAAGRCQIIQPMDNLREVADCNLHS